MATYKVYTGSSFPTRERHRTEEELAYFSALGESSPEYEEVRPESLFLEKGTPEGFESEDFMEAMRYANALRKMFIYSGVWVEYEDAEGVRKIEYVHSDHCLRFRSTHDQEFIEGDGKINGSASKSSTSMPADESFGVWGIWIGSGNRMPNATYGRVSSSYSSCF